MSTTSQEHAIQIQALLSNGTLDTYLTSIEVALRARRNAINPAPPTPRKLEVWDFRPRERCWLTLTCSTRYLRGLEVEIVKPNRKRIDVRLIDQTRAGRFIGTFNVPPSLLSKTPVFE